jgi:hypothetical protein
MFKEGFKGERRGAPEFGDPARIARAAAPDCGGVAFGSSCLK